MRVTQQQNDAIENEEHGSLSFWFDCAMKMYSCTILEPPFRIEWTVKALFTPLCESVCAWVCTSVCARAICHFLQSPENGGQLPGLKHGPISQSQQRQLLSNRMIKTHWHTRTERLLYQWPASKSQPTPDRVEIVATEEEGGGEKEKKRHKLHLRLSQRSGLPWGNPTVPAQTANGHTGLHCDANSGEQNKVCHQHMRSYIHTIYETKHARVCIITFMTAQQTILTSTAAAAKAGCDGAEYGYRLTHTSTSTEPIKARPRWCVNLICQCHSKIASACRNTSQHWALLQCLPCDLLGFAHRHWNDVSDFMVIDPVVSTVQKSQ